jgi:hypothetical protein
MSDRTVAVEFLDSLPGRVLGGMLTEIGADPNDDIAAHPELWDRYELPTALRRLDPKQTVAIAVPDERLNNNAAAIGLGLEHCEFDPEAFDALVYEPPDGTGTAISFTDGPVVALDSERDAPGAALDAFLDRIAELGLLEDPSGVSVAERRVSELIAAE